VKKMSNEWGGMSNEDNGFCYCSLI
jgi:hypothetical protein